jgi:magnesium-transporting ATPase (P-type)
MGCNDLNQDQNALRLCQLRALGNVSVVCFAAVCALWISNLYTPSWPIMFLVPVSSLLVSCLATISGDQQLMRQPKEDNLSLLGPRLATGLARIGLLFGILSFVIFFLVNRSSAISPCLRCPQRTSKQF